MNKILAILCLSLMGCAHGGLHYVSAPKSCEWGDSNPIKNIEVCPKLRLINGDWIEACECVDYGRFLKFEENEWQIKFEKFKRDVKDITNE